MRRLKLHIHAEHEVASHLRYVGQVVVVDVDFLVEQVVAVQRYGVFALAPPFASVADAGVDEVVAVCGIFGHGYGVEAAGACFFFVADVFVVLIHFFVGFGEHALRGAALGEDAGVFEGGEPVAADFAGESESESGGGRGRHCGWAG